MTEPPIDFSSLQPGDGEYWERLARRVEATADAELARRSGVPDGLERLLLRRRTPILALAASVAVAAGVALLRLPQPHDPFTVLVADLAGISYETASVLTADRPPSWTRLLRDGGRGR